MSYQVLARKWRPKNFSEVVGQAHILKILANALSLGRVHHAYLFSGTRGVGKTSIARLLAKGLNCEQGITATPCGECEHCRDIEQGRFVDLIEIDAASRTKVEDTREILDNIQYLPTRGRFKVYLIDEVHMLSRSSFNALLKTLEEPPEHVKFLLATTDPQKLPITILSRCLHLHLKMLEPEQIEQQLAKILTAEQLDFEARALALLAKVANGSMRDALSLTDQAIALGNGQVDAQSVAGMLGSLDQSIAFSLLESVLNSDGNAIMQQLQQIALQGVDWDLLLGDCLALLHQIALLQLVPTALGDYQNQEQRIRHLAQLMLPQDIQLYYQMLLNSRKELPWMLDKKMVVEMAFLRILAFQPQNFQQAAAPAQSEAPAAIEQPIAAVKPTAKPATTVNPKPAAQPKAEPKASPAANSELPPLAEGTSDLTRQILQARQQLMTQESEPKKPQAEPVNPPSKSKSSRLEAVKQGNYQRVQPASSEAEKNTAETYRWQAKQQPSTEASQIKPKDLRKALEHEKTPEMMQKLTQLAAEQDSWAQEIEQLQVTPLVKQLAINAFVVKPGANHYQLHLRSNIAHLNTATNRQGLQQALSELQQQPIELSIEVDDAPTQATPLEIREKIYQQLLEQSKQIVHQDDKIALLCQMFEAQIDEESIRPV